MKNVIILTTLMLIYLEESIASYVANPRILGGTQAKPGQYPWIIALYKIEANNKTSHFCGGAIVDEYRVLTAGHCVYDKDPEELEVVAGAHNLKLEEASRVRAKVIDIEIHPEYISAGGGGPYDTAILQLASPLIFNSRITSITPALSGEKHSSPCVSAGWGNMFPLSPLHYKGSDVLQTGFAEIVEPGTCKLSYPAQAELLNAGICARAGLLAGTCQGDSGGPLVCFREDKSPYLAGLVSWGFTICGDMLHPDIYSDLGNSKIFNFIVAPKKRKRTKVKASAKASSKLADIDPTKRTAAAKSSSPAAPGIFSMLASQKSKNEENIARFFSSL